MKLITKLNEQNGKLWKQTVLTDIMHPEWQTFVTAYDPYSIYHLKFKDYDMERLGEPSKIMFNILAKLTNREVTGQAARDMVIAHAQREGDLIKLICNKDLRCGVTATTFNKVHPGSIPSFKVQLAKEVPIETLSYPLIAQIKYDGVRIIAIKEEGKVTFRTRNGMTVVLSQLQTMLEKSIADNFILDGEMTFAEGKLDGRTSISGAINSAMHGGIIDESDLMFNIFDVMPLTDWQAAKCAAPYHKRWLSLIKLLTWLGLPNVIPAACIEVESAKDVELYYDVLIEQGYEGVILKSADHLYTFKRSKDWVKLKEVKTADLTCTGWFNGDGKYEGLIGVLTLAGEVEGKQVKVNVGSGLTDKDRTELIFDDEYGFDVLSPKFFGSLVEIKYNSVIRNAADDGWTLFLPRYVCVRTDK